MNSDADKSDASKAARDDDVKQSLVNAHDQVRAEGSNNKRVGRKQAGRFQNKGRKVDAAALSQVRQLLGERPRARDLLIEHLHLVQDACGGLQPRMLHALAEEMRLPMAEVYEVATFYAHFDVLADDQTRLPEVTVRVCDSLPCMLKGSAKLHAALAACYADDGQSGARDVPDVRVVRAPCMGRCDQAPVAEVGHNHITMATSDAIEAAIAGKQTDAQPPSDVMTFSDYRAGGGYAVLEACRNGTRSYEEISETLSQANLRGLGGAGFPLARKWGLVRRQPDDGDDTSPRVVCINADEGEPGTFKDRFYMERDPHRLLEGMLIAAWAVEADICFIYLRDEYPGLRKVLQRAIADIERAEIIAPGTVVLRRGAGAYICGEESAMIESIEGKRGLPRHRPPYVAQVGVFGRPTLVHNVETVFWLREILEKGGAWFAGHGENGRSGLRSFSVSGRVRVPGVKLAPAGITVKALIEKYCGGMAEGHTFKAYRPGGASGGVLPAELGDLPLDFGTLEEHGCFIGSAAVIVLSDQDDMRAVACNLMQFFADESCGQCTPCRAGTVAALHAMQQEVWDAPLLEALSETMADASICGLGQAAPNPIRSVLKHFPHDVGVPQEVGVPREVGVPHGKGAASVNAQTGTQEPGRGEIGDA